MQLLQSRLLLIAALLVSFSVAIPNSSMAAPDGWEKYKKPKEAGFSNRKIRKAYKYWQSLRPDAGATIVVYKGKILVSWGETTYKFMCHSVRKSFLSALYGIHVKEKNINLNKTMAELGIEDDPPLTDAEKQAKVIHLLMARSGVYHEAAYEAPEMKESRPERGSHAPGTFWYYNNWDFNTLGTIFRQETGLDIFQEFKDRIADPIGMEDFQLEDCYYHYELQYSIHPAYPFRMSARDRARFGQLFLQDGKWGDEQIVPKKWVRKITKKHSDASEGEPEAEGIWYGYMWWIFDKELFEKLDSSEENHLKNYDMFFASGYRGHLITVIPDADMVFVMCVNTDLGSQNVQVTTSESMILLNMIFDAQLPEKGGKAAPTMWKKGSLPDLSAYR